MTIPTSIVICAGTVLMAVQAWHSDDWKWAAIAGIAGSCLNCLFFLRRVLIQNQLHQRIHELRTQLKASTKTGS